jgi:hypothetical protein
MGGSSNTVPTASLADVVFDRRRETIWAHARARNCERERARRGPSRRPCDEASVKLGLGGSPGRLADAERLSVQGGGSKPPRPSPDDRHQPRGTLIFEVGLNYNLWSSPVAGEPTMPGSLP